MNKKRYYSPVLLIIFISFLVYLNALRNGFVWDDMVLIADNEGINKWGCFWENFVRDFFDTTDDTIEFKYGYYRPIISLSYMIDYALWGLKPWGFHLSNIIFHTISCVLVYLIFNSLFNNRSISITTSLLFACHPIHTESVTWISGRTDIIAGMFFLSAFYLYQKAIHSPLPGERNSSLCNREVLKLFYKQSKIFYVCSIILFAVAMLCKEMVATLPFLIIAYTHFFVGLRNGRQCKISLLLSTPYFFVILLYGIIRFTILGIHTVDNPGGEEMKGFYPTLFSFTKTIFIYLCKLIYPAHLNAYIQNPMSFSITEPTVFSSAIGVSFLIFLIVWLKKRWAGMSFLILFYLVTLLPLSNFIRISAPWDMGFVTAERFLYIPSLGFCGIISVLLTTAWKSWKRSFSILRYTTISLFIALLIFYSGQTLLRNRDWIDEKTFFSKTLKEAPNAALLHHAMGNVYVREENYERALGYYKNSLELYPLYHAAYNNIGTIYSKQGLYDQALAAFKEAIKINPDYIQSHFNLGTTYYQKGMTEDASREFKIVLTFNKNYVKAHNNLGIIYAENGQLHEAIAEFEEVLKLDPHSEKALNNLAIIKEELASKSLNKNL
ncbi:MAG TPA: tetratricopeptide repeat protein [Candidatus Wunengus sp. YC63]|uniref:tetratricopeptide repeat protein n=1 Tax=unclassified Candidatus Wunengus TaxID=3367695 RepID=UPI00402663FA